MSVKTLSVFFPAYNEEQNIQSTIEKAIKVLSDLNIKWEILVINDGSKDRTGELAEEIAKKYPWVKVIHQLNGGYGMALRAGFANSKYEWIAYTDADGQFDFSEIHKFLEQAENGVDAIWGYRIKRQDHFIRLLFAKGWAISIFILFGIWLNDIDCGFKMFKKEVINAILPLRSKRGAMINAELVIKMKKANFKIGQVGVNHYPRQAGKPTGASLKVIIQSYLDLFRLWWDLR